MSQNLHAGFQRLSEIEAFKRLAEPPLVAEQQRLQVERADFRQQTRVVRRAAVEPFAGAPPRKFGVDAVIVGSARRNPSAARGNFKVDLRVKIRRS